MDTSQSENFIQKARLRQQASEALNAIQSNLWKVDPTKFPNLNPQASQYLSQGVLNRFVIIEENYRWLYLNTVDTTETLPTNVARQASIILNSIYLHATGIIDNFAWIFYYQVDMKGANSINPVKVALFNKAVLNLIPNIGTKYRLLCLYAWEKELRKKRHPVAHRLPLIIPGQVLSSEEESERYKELQSLYIKTQNEYLQCLRDRPKNFEDSIEGTSKELKYMDNLEREYESRLNEIEKERRALGGFRPYFGYPDDNKFVPIYPTVPLDMVNLSFLTDICLELLKVL